MDEATHLEAQAVRSLLASQPMTERERIESSGIPSRSFERAKHKALLKGWMLDRYIPNPCLIGTPIVSFVMAQPFAEETLTFCERWKETSSTVILWKWPERLFAVFVTQDPPREVFGLADPEYQSRLLFQVEADARLGQVPVYFDFEGSWSSLLGAKGPLSYPHPLPGATPEGGTGSLLPSRDLRRVAGLLERPLGDPTGGGGPRSSPFFLARAERRLVVEGVLERRFLLNPCEIPAVEGHEVESLVFIHGEVKDGATPERLFRQLLGIGVTPFLFATDAHYVVMGAISSVPAVDHRGGGTRSVLGTIEGSLRGIRIERLPLKHMSGLVNHRYGGMIHLP